jgi:hypothetical protein
MQERHKAETPYPAHKPHNVYYFIPRKYETGIETKTKQQRLLTDA